MELQRARAEWCRIYPLMDAMMSAPFISAVKTALNVAGCPAGSPRQTILDLDPATAETISTLVTQLRESTLR